MAAATTEDGFERRAYGFSAFGGFGFLGVGSLTHTGPLLSTWASRGRRHVNCELQDGDATNLGISRGP